MTGNSDYLNPTKGAFGASGTLANITTETSKSNVLLLETPTLERFWQPDGQTQFRDFAQRLLTFYQNRVKLSAIVYCHAIGRESDEQKVLKCLDIFDQILGPRIYHRLFAVEVLPESTDIQQGSAEEIWSQRLARWQRRGATAYKINRANSKNKAILPSLVSETGVYLDLQTKLIQQTYAVDSAASHFLPDTDHSAQIERPKSSASNTTIASPPRTTDSSLNSIKNSRPLSAQSHLFRASVTPIPMSLEEAYSRLGENQIRLVRLLGGPVTDAISINLFQVELEDSTDYEALSYVVGYQLPSTHLSLRLGSGEIAKVPITHNLENILKTLRYPDKDRILWVDALSIAQQDAEEKAAQIQNMGRIFETARNVCVWLGPEIHATNAAMEFIPRVLDFTDMDAIFANTKDVHERWISLVKLMTVPYFGRRFIVQEVAFARKATVYCGSKTVDWIDLVDAAVLLEKHWPVLVSQLSHQERDSLGDIHAPGAMSLVQLTSRSLQKNHAGHVQARLVDMETLLTALPMFDTSLPHDTIYSILSLARDTYQTTSLRVDYTMDPVELFAEAVISIVKATGSPDMMCRPWAPFIGGSNGQYDRRGADGLVGLPGRRIYQASGVTNCLRDFQYSNIGSKRSLTLRGVELGIVSIAYEKSQNGNIPDDWLRFRWLAYEMTLSAAQIQARETSFEATSTTRRMQFREVLWRTLFADRMKDGQAAPRWYVRACHHCLSTPGEHWGEQAVNLNRLIQRSPEKLGEVLSRIRDTIWGRKLFGYQHTPVAGPGAEDRLYSSGIGPGELYVGDIVAVLFGCSVPLILRKLPRQNNQLASTQQPDRYELIGEAYIYGMMDGEALEKKDDGSYLRTEKSFEIC
ncbi:hypothetical protein H2200_011113 [Cladophialophora chaetospira]|uniref:Heterokaryon incompatibility domain-containing protein n=1 Tax=Cladophialophora chaetospira TaxID=386627 RepID=A0AA39CDI2_9EURO|nr:hypothetical protein H2200_011113 [Cladophialophora chaetospira]